MKEFMLITHFIGLSMGVGSGFAFMFLRIAGEKIEKSEQSKFRLNTMVLSRMGNIGLGLLVISGLYLITPYWHIIGSMPLLITKLTLVLILSALLGITSFLAKKAKKENSESQFKNIEKLGPLSMLVSLTIIVLAVLIFQ